MIQLTAEAALRQTLGAAHNIASIRAGSDMPQPSSRIDTRVRPRPLEVQPDVTGAGGDAVVDEVRYRTRLQLTRHPAN